MIFERIAEAYDVLSNRKLKATFDLLGEIGLKDGVPDVRGGRKGAFTRSKTLTDGHLQAVLRHG